MPERATPEETAYAHRLNLLFVVAVAAWGAFFVTYAFLGRWWTVAIDATVIALTLATRAWAFRIGGLRRLRAGLHIGLGISAGGISAAALVSGQGESMALWYLAAAPLFAAYQQGIRAAVGWAVIASLMMGAVHASELFVNLGPEFVATGWELILGRMVLVGVVAAFAVATALANNRHVRMLEDRERVIAERSGALSDARDEALAAAQAKSAFLANMSHEIRTPLNGVIGITQLLSSTALTREQQGLVKTIESSGGALLTIINEILDYSKIEAGVLDIDAAPFELHECVEDVLDLFATAAWDKQIDLAYRIYGSVPNVVVCDQMRVRQVLTNLVGNAVKFTDDGAVVVSVDAPDVDTLRIVVRDTGVGMTSEVRKRLFQPFEQGDSSTSRKYGGTGLGLVISKRIVDALDGTLEVDSEPGSGSEFRVHLPLARGNARDVAVFVPNDLSEWRVMIVDPQIESANALSALLKSWSASVSVATNAKGLHAMLAQDAEIDVVFASSAIEDLPTHADAIRAAVPHAQIVLLSSRGNAQTHARMTESGFDDVLYKPFRQRRVAALFEALRTGEPPDTRKFGPLLDERLAERIPLSILIAEDNPVNRRVLLHILEQLGYEPDYAVSGTEAVEAAQSSPYDVILMDMQMPGLDGLEATRRIRTSSLETQPRIIATTANVLDDQRKACEAAGMDDFVAKPIEVGALIAALERCAPQPSMRMRRALEPKEALEQLLEVFRDDYDDLVDLIDGHVRNSHQLAVDVQDAVKAGNFDKLRRSAHSLRGSAASFGSGDVAKLADEIENCAIRDDLVGAESRVSSLLTAVEQAGANLRRTLAERRPGPLSGKMPRKRA